uniref:BHLH-MYC_N domain-containing protein n=1 Tax=Ascaris lumbricoides TaxID=6252 RepID=A0A0M3IG56_ASCLU
MERFLKKTAVPGSSNAAAHRTLNASTTEVEVGQKQLPDVSLSMRSTRANIDNTKKLLDIAKLFDVKWWMGHSSDTLVGPSGEIFSCGGDE